MYQLLGGVLQPAAVLPDGLDNDDDKDNDNNANCTNVNNKTINNSINSSNDTSNDGYIASIAISLSPLSSSEAYSSA